MATATLVREARLQGWRVLETMHRSQDFNFDVQAAFWRYDEEREAWRLYIVTPQVDVAGPLHLYGELQRILAQLDRVQRQNDAANVTEEAYVNDDEELRLDDITFVGPNDPISNDMRRRYASVPFDRSVVRRVSLTRDEPYIYQL